jgi:hypothetical protein
MSNNDPKEYIPEKPGKPYIIGIVLLVVLFGAATSGILLAPVSIGAHAMQHFETASRASSVTPLLVQKPQRD